MPDFTVDINLSSISNNKSGTASNSNPGGGGALILTLTSAAVNSTISKSTFANNYAAGKGGGLFLHSTAGVFSAKRESRHVHRQHNRQLRRRSLAGPVRDDGQPEPGQRHRQQ